MCFEVFLALINNSKSARKLGEYGRIDRRWRQGIVDYGDESGDEDVGKDGGIDGDGARKVTVMMAMAMDMEVSSIRHYG